MAHPEHPDEELVTFNRLCDCGGKPEIVFAQGDDCVARYERCHIATRRAYTTDESAIQAWNNRKLSESPYELFTDHLERNLSGKVRFFAFDPMDLTVCTEQSCNCYEVMAVRDGGGVKIEIEQEPEGLGAVCFEEFACINHELYTCRAVPTEGESIEFDSIRYDEHGFPEAVKYRWGDRFFFIYASGDHLLVIKSKYDLFKNNTYMLQTDDSVLFP